MWNQLKTLLLLGTLTALVAGAAAWAAPQWWVVIAAASVLFNLGAWFFSDRVRSPLAALMFALIAPVAALVVQLAISRSREYVADATAARLTGDPEALASALVHLSRAADIEPQTTPVPAAASLFIVNPLGGGARFAAWFSTHPPMERRIERLRRLAVRLGAAA